MIGPKISHDPGFKMGRDRVLNPPESGFSHELPDNDTRVGQPDTYDNYIIRNLTVLTG